MRNLLAMTVAALICGCAWPAPGQPSSQIPVTDYSLRLLSAVNQTNAWSVLGITATNQTEVTNWITTIPASTVTPAMLKTEVTNAWQKDATNYVIQTNDALVTQINTVNTNLAARLILTNNAIVGRIAQAETNVLDSTGAVVAYGRTNTLIFSLAGTPSGTNKSDGWGSSILLGTNNSIAVNNTNAIIVGGSKNSILDLSPNRDGQNTSVILGGEGNVNQGRSSVIVGGMGNKAYDSSYGIILAGSNNTMSNHADFAAIIAGGANRMLSPGVDDSVIIGGTENEIRSAASAIVGGTFNTVSDTSDFVLISGSYNTVTNSVGASILGGTLNNIANSLSSSISGGHDNIVTNAPNSHVLGDYNTVEGGATWTDVDLLSSPGPGAIAFGSYNTNTAQGSISIGSNIENTNAYAVRIGRGTDAVNIGTNGSVTAKGIILNTVFIQTNTLVCPAGLITGGYLWNSNQVLYWVTSTQTNLLSNGR